MVVKLPDTLAMCHEPPVEKSLEEMEKLLLLILGAAVQCSHKEDLIGSIKNLPIETQHAFVDKIKEVCDCDLFFIAVCIIFNVFVNVSVTTYAVLMKWNSGLVTKRLFHCLPKFHHLESKQ